MREGRQSDKVDGNNREVEEGSDSLVPTNYTCRLVKALNHPEEHLTCCFENAGLEWPNGISGLVRVKKSSFEHASRRWALHVRALESSVFCRISRGVLASAANLDHFYTITLAGFYTLES